ncbi:polysaccharide biosynthesis/export family protein [Terriglobus sp.]|uniref:polysaccharide biosynthesis/export family protein n=1 Tax=Terriglobus sp. TaxID=1889013 RepID=UPI003B0081E7
MRVVSGVLAVCWVGLAAGAQTRPAIAPPASQAGRTATSDAATNGATAIPATATANPQSVVSEDSYVIGPGDQLQLTVWKEPNLSNGGVPVRPDGRISLPLLGDVPAAGMTPMLLGRDIASRLQKFVTDPLVTVTMLSVAPKEIFLIGEIQKTGPVILTPGMNLLQAIAAAGGLTPFAKKKLYVLRKSEKGQQKLNFNYKKALSNGDMQGITLMAGDTIVSL